MGITDTIILLSVGLISGSLNAVAGGGTFIAFPALVWIGLLPIKANATATFALWPGTLTTIFAFRKELVKNKDKLPLFLSLSIFGGLIGAEILLHISNNRFASIVPYLLFAATMLFTFRNHLIKWVSATSVSYGSGYSSPFFRIVIIFLFIAISIYGGFFGAGMGILLLGLFSLMGMQNLYEMSALRSCSGLFANIIAIILFGAYGIILWPQAIIMAIGASIGGYGAAHFSLRLPQTWSRNAVVVIAWVMTLYFFCKQWI